MNLKSNSNKNNAILIQKTHLHQINIDDLSVQWRELEQHSTPQFFLSWQWIAAWLESLRSEKNAFVLHFTQDEKTIALGIFIQCTKKRSGILTVNQGYLHRTGDESLDQIWIENNGLLIRNNYSSQVINIFTQWFTNEKSIDELVINVAKENPLNKHKHLNNINIIESEHSHGRHVLLSQYSTLADYLTALSRNTRQHINRSYRELSRLGKPSFSVTDDLKKQLLLLAQYKHWHVAKWRNTTTPSGWENEHFEKFHQRLINKNNSESTTLIATLAIDAEVIGLLYCFTQADTVYFYLSSLKPFYTNKIKIGLTMHTLVIEWLIENMPTVKKYDFLAGDSRYKESLSTHQDNYSCITLQKKHWKFSLESYLKEIKRRIVG